MTDLAYIANDNIVELTGLQDIDGNYLNSATVALSDVVGTNDISITGQTFPVAMSYVATSDGVYRATMEDTLAFVDATNYLAKIDVIAIGLQAHFELEFIARVRKHK